MHPSISLLWTWNRSLGRLAYLAAGSALFALKFAIDWNIARLFFGRSWSPLNYLVWPNDQTLRVLDLADPDRTFALTMLAASVPFIWSGVMLTLHRLRSAGMPLSLIVLFFVPVANLLFFAMLVVLPPQHEPSAAATGVMTERQYLRRRLRTAHQQFARDSYWRSGFVALAVTVPLAVIGVVVGAEILRSYGFTLFVGGPFAIGMFSVLIFGFSRPQPLGACLAVAMSATLVSGIAVLVFALEGAICLILAAPIVFTLQLFGALVGYAIQSRPWLNDHSTVSGLMVLFMLPSLMAAESAHEPEPDVRAVRTSIIIDAPPEKVWAHVIAFPPLPEPDDWLFRTGLAYPQRAEIHGTGVGAVRYCVFSTGAFVEPIEIWEPPTLLRFAVSEQPPPLKEWSPYDVHPAHLDHYLASLRGEFLLERLSDGRTCLCGTTWYTNRMWPATYWHVWSDYIIQRIHGRVLTHIRNLAQEK
jgi:hypothetical protein